MTDVVVQAANPDHDVTASRELLALMDEAATSREHWKILLTSSIGFFTDAYDLFISGVVALDGDQRVAYRQLPEVAAVLAGPAYLGSRRAGVRVGRRQVRGSADFHAANLPFGAS